MNTMQADLSATHERFQADMVNRETEGPGAKPACCWQWPR